MASIVLPFADGAYAFALFAGQIRELEEKADAGPMEIYRRLLTGSWRMVDVVETIRLGLVGGGRGWVGGIVGEDGAADGGQEITVEAAQAVKLVRAYVQTYAAEALDPDRPETLDQGAQPWASSAILASQIIAAGLMGRAREELGKKPEGETADPSLSPTADSAGQPSSQATPTEG